MRRWPRRSIPPGADVDDVHRLGREPCEFAPFIHGAGLAVTLVRPRPVRISGFPADWRAHHETCGCIRIDPAVRRAIVHCTPLIRDHIMPLEEREAATIRDFMGEAHAVARGCIRPQFDRLRGCGPGRRD